MILVTKLAKKQKVWINLKSISFMFILYTIWDVTFMKKEKNYD